MLCIQVDRTQNRPERPHIFPHAPEADVGLVSAQVCGGFASLTTHVVEGGEQILFPRGAGCI
jgi:hypothetical protein